MTESKWNGFKRLDFDFIGRETIVVFADETNRTDKWLLKTEYFDAFPETELALIARGYNLVYLKNITRWGNIDDFEKKFLLSKFLTKEYGFRPSCATVGMSCGGLHAVYLAAKHPEMVSVMYLDAPVLNLLSCPSYMGLPPKTKEIGENFWTEFYEAKGITRSELICRRDHPIDMAHVLLEHKIPIILVSGDSDQTVPYCENGALLEKLYRENSGEIEVYIKKDGDHHPHGLPDVSKVVEFIERYY